MGLKNAAPWQFDYWFNMPAGRVSLTHLFSRFFTCARCLNVIDFTGCFVKGVWKSEIFWILEASWDVLKLKISHKIIIYKPLNLRDGMHHLEKERAYFPSKLVEWNGLYFGEMHFKLLPKHKQSLHFTLFASFPPYKSLYRKRVSLRAP